MFLLQTKPHSHPPTSGFVRQTDLHIPSPIRPLRQVNKAGSTEEEQFEELKREKMGKFKFAEEEVSVLSGNTLVSRTLSLKLQILPSRWYCAIAKEIAQ